MLGSPSPLLDVLALNVGKDCVQRSSEKFACRLDARSCGMEKVGRCYPGAGSLVGKRAHSGQLGPHRSAAILDERKCLGLRSPCAPLKAGSSLPLRFSLGDALAEEEVKALAKGSSFPLVDLCLHGSRLSTLLLRLQRTHTAFLVVLHAGKCGLTLQSP